MRNRIIIAAIYADAYKHRAIEVATKTKDKVIENKAELARLGATAAVVGVAARVAGFKAGYEFAKTN